MWKRSYAAAAVLLSLLGVAGTRAEANDAVLDWNEVAANATLTAVPALAPVQQSRAMAIAQVAVHDAVNGVSGLFETYLAHGAAPAGSSQAAAAIGAGHAVLKGLFPSQGAALDAARAASLVEHGVSPTDPGLEFGAAVAAAILANRANDGASVAQFVYIPPGAGSPGVWAPLGTQVALLPGFGSVAPFVLRSGSQFRPDPPPALDSHRYERDYNEVRVIGAVNSPLRTAEQTNIALFWRGSPVSIWNPIARQALGAHVTDLSEAARTLALVWIASSDASVACWDAKYIYNYWRPLPAILGGNLDDNPGTIADPAWQPLLPTPAHPEYPSGHGCNSSSSAHILVRLFGDNPGFTIVATSPAAPAGFVRYWDTFSEGVEEVIDARVYSGIHFRTADKVGARLGRQVAQYVIRHALKPRRPRR
jgi:hypothetical protein